MEQLMINLAAQVNRLAVNVKFRGFIEIELDEC